MENRHYRNYTETQLKEAITSSTSIRQVLAKLGLREAGGNYQTMRKLIKALGLDVSHFTGKAHNRGKKLPFKRPVEDYLSNSYTITSVRLKNRLLAEGLLQRKCYHCNLTLWLDNPIPLELDHIDGNYKNNNLTNLQLLCPNCHALTPNYRGKNKGSYPKS